MIVPPSNANEFFIFHPQYPLSNSESLLVGGNLKHAQREVLATATKGWKLVVRQQYPVATTPQSAQPLSKGALQQRCLWQRFSPPHCQLVPRLFGILRRGWKQREEFQIYMCQTNQYRTNGLISIFYSTCYLWMILRWNLWMPLL